LASCPVETCSASKRTDYQKKRDSLSEAKETYYRGKRALSRLALLSPTTHTPGAAVATTTPHTPVPHPPTHPNTHTQKHTDTHTHIPTPTHPHTHTHTLSVMRETERGHFMRPSHSTPAISLPFDRPFPLPVCPPFAGGMSTMDN
jgi:hypothetical protein